MAPPQRNRSLPAPRVDGELAAGSLRVAASIWLVEPASDIACRARKWNPECETILTHVGGILCPVQVRTNN